MGDVVQLKYFPLSSSSQDTNDGSLTEISKMPNKSKGWISGRFCRYPQYLYIRFQYPVHLTQMNILIHEKKIPSRIDFYSYFPQTQTEFANTDYINLPYVNFGYIKFDTNERSSFLARECKKVFLDIDTYNLKLEIGKNYLNRYNSFHQVGVISIEFYGTILKGGIDNYYLKKSESNRNFMSMINKNEIGDEELEEICGEKLRLLKEKISKSIENELYDDCKMYKELIDKVRTVGIQIYTKENQKLDAVNKEDFDTAIILKSEIGKLRDQMDKIIINPIKPKIVQQDNENKENMDNNKIIPEEIKEEIPNVEDEEDLNKDIKLNNSNAQNISTISKRITHTKLNKSTNNLLKITEEDYKGYDDIIPPAVLKRQHNKSSNDLSDYLEESNEQVEQKGELEEIDLTILQQYPLLLKFLEEEGMRKLFSKQIQYKDQGFELLFQKLTDMFSSEEDCAPLIIELSKLITDFIEEKHPNTIINIFDLIIDIIECVNLNSKLDCNINHLFNERMYKKITEKLGDATTKIRKKAIELYIFLLKQDTISYTELISRLIERDIKNYNNIYISQSSKSILSKLAILKEQLENLSNDSKENFPKNLVGQYLINNVTNSKSEIRKVTRYLISKFISIFGVKLIGTKLSAIEPRELNKLKDEIPELKEYLDDLNLMKNEKINMNNISVASRKSRSKSKDKLERNNSKYKIKIKSDECNYCHAHLGNKDLLAAHKENDCPMFIKCPKCSINIEVKRLNPHLLYECAMKSNYKLCKRCREAINIDVYEVHIKENRCNPAKNANSSNRCPLCHKDIPPSDKGFYTHLAVTGCECQSRKTNKDL